MLERAERPAAPSRRDPRETLELLLDDLMRALSFEKAVVLLYDEERAALVGSFGIGVSDAAARGLVVPISPSDEPIASGLRTRVPQPVRDATTDSRVPADAREAVLCLGLWHQVAA